MCYYNGQKVTREEYIRLKHIEKQVAKYNFLNRDVIDGFDFGVAAVLKPKAGEEDFDIVPMEWGFIPDPLSWPFWETRQQVAIGRQTHKDSRGQVVQGLNFLNAISEELLLPNKVYRKAALSRPCLFLSSGYYEWRHVFPLNKRTGEVRKTAVKYPYRIYLANREYFYMAGVWQEWTDAETGEMVETATIITTAANEVGREIHNNKKRQPTILTDDLAWEWLFGERTEKRIKEIATYQHPYQDMRYYTLAKDFLNSTDPLKQYYYPELPPMDIPGGDLSYGGDTGPLQTSLF